MPVAGVGAQHGVAVPATWAAIRVARWPSRPTRSPPARPRAARPETGCLETAALRLPPSYSKEDRLELPGWLHQLRRPPPPASRPRAAARSGGVRASRTAVQTAAAITGPGPAGPRPAARTRTGRLVPATGFPSAAVTQQRRRRGLLAGAPSNEADHVVRSARLLGGVLADDVVRWSGDLASPLTRPGHNGPHGTSSSSPLARRRLFPPDGRICTYDRSTMGGQDSAGGKSARTHSGVPAPHGDVYTWYQRGWNCSAGSRRGRPAAGTAAEATGSRSVLEALGRAQFDTAGTTTPRDFRRIVEPARAMIRPFRAGAGVAGSATTGRRPSTCAGRRDAAELRHYTDALRGVRPPEGPSEASGEPPGTPRGPCPGPMPRRGPERTDRG